MTKEKKKHEDLNEEEVLESNGEAMDEPIQDAADATVEEELERVKAEAAEYLDGWQRARAEFANYKKRTDRENEEARQRITGEIITRYLGVVDDFERALARAPEEEACQEWTAGVELIYQKLWAILEAEGVEAIQAEGERFDPNLHEAISYEESEDHEEGTVIEVTQRGYRLGERILRPAMVRVAR
ncbi:MAG: nucleotide exchange factor GrpE [Anaerolineales bacterium]